MKRPLFWINFLSVTTILAVLLSLHPSEPDPSGRLEGPVSGDYLRVEKILNLVICYATDSERPGRKPVYPAKLDDLVPQYISASDFYSLYPIELHYHYKSSRFKKPGPAWVIITLHKVPFDYLGIEDGVIVEQVGDKDVK